uniref:ABC transporter permease n=1 Tax=Ignisphaera aggregans TaxID=334771 RepID=A0A7J3I8X6_9CREN
MVGVNSMARYLDLKISLAIIVALIIFSIVIPQITPYDPRSWNVVPRDRPPSLRYPFGTTSTGQDVLVLSAWALRNSLILGSIAAALLVSIAFTIGSIAGGTRNTVIRGLLTYLIDSFCVIPFLPILIMIGSLWRETLGIIGTALVIALLGWGGQARNVRSVIMGLRERTFTYTAIFSGYGTLKLIYRSYLPYIVRWLSIAFLFGIIFCIGLETTLSVFGITSLENPTIGTMIFWTREYQAYLRGLWWWYTFPLVLFIAFLVAMYIVVRRLITIFIEGIR